MLHEQRTIVRTFSTHVASRAPGYERLRLGQACCMPAITAVCSCFYTLLACEAIDRHVCVCDCCAPWRCCGRDCDADDSWRPKPHVLCMSPAIVNMSLASCVCRQPVSTCPSRLMYAGSPSTCACPRRLLALLIATYKCMVIGVRTHAMTRCPV